jgi:phage-related protein
MSITLGDLIVRIRGEQRDLDGDLTQAEKKVESSAGKMGGFFSGALQHAVGGAILGGVVGIGSAVADGIGGAVKAGFDFNRSMENASAQINAFTKDGAKTAEILDMIKTRAAATPFAFEEMTTAAAALIPTAKQAGVGLEDLIKEAEILAASNPAQGLEGAAFALKEAVSGDFTSIIERFNLPRKFINDLRKEGVPDLEIVRRAMKELGLDTDLVANLANTADGRWSTLKDTFTNLAGSITQPVFDALSSSLGEVIELVSAPALQQGITAIGTGLSTTLAGGIRTVMDLVKAFQTGGTDGLLGALGLTPSMQATVKNVLGGIQEAAQAAVTWVSANWPQIQDTISTVLNAVVNLIRAPLLPTIGTIIEKGREVVDWLIVNWPAIESAIKPILQGIVDFIRDPVVPVLGAIIEKGREIVDWLVANWPAIEAAVKPVLQGVVDFIRDPLLPILNDIALAAGKVVNWFQTNWPGIQSTVETVLTGVITKAGEIVAWFETNWAGLSTSVGKVLDAIVAIIKDPFLVVLDSIITSAKDIVSWFTSNWAALEGLVTSVFENIKTFMDVFLPPFIKLVSGAFESIKTSIDTILNAALGIIQTVMKLINGDWEGAWQSFKETFEGIWEGIKKFFDGLPKAMLEIGKSIIDGLIKGVEAKAEEFKNALLNTLPPAIREVLKTMGIASPSKVMMEIGNQIMDGLILPFQQRKGEFAAAVRDVVGSAAMDGLMLPQLAAAGAGFGIGSGASADAPGNGRTAGRSAGVVNVSVGPVYINKDQDIDDLAYRIARRIQDY